MPAYPLNHKHYIAIFIIALSTIATQILFSRIFSVTLYYHFAFAGITFAMLGLTAGTLQVYTKPEQFSIANANQVLAKHSLYFAITLILSVLLHAYVPGLLVQLYGNEFWALLLAKTCFGVGVILLLPVFIQSGICIAFLLTRFPENVGRLYAFDLGGAAFGCIGVILMLKLFDPFSTLLFFAITIAAVSWSFLSEKTDPRLRLQVKITTAILVLLCVVQTATYIQGSPVFRVSWAKNTYASQPIFERWNTYSRITISDYESKTPIGWGFGATPKAQVNQKYLTIDADAASAITEFKGDPKTISYLKDDIINLGYSIRNMENVAVIGVGGGRDILSALAFGAKRVKGIEINPTIFDALTDKFGEFTGHIDKHPGVSLANAEARSYLNSNKETYDLIQISLIDTWAATAAGGLTLSENKLYTTNAWDDFFDRLGDNGVLALSRWYSDTHQGELYRLLAIASKILKERDPTVNPRDHILAAYVNPNAPNTYSHQVVTVLLSKSALTPEEVQRFVDTCHRLNFLPLLTPTLSNNETAAKIASGNVDSAFFDTLPMDVTAPSDDKPFFFNMIRPISLLTGKVSLFDDQPDNNNMAVVTLCKLLLLTFVASIYFIGGPMKLLYRNKSVPLADILPNMIYFGGIGLGFMLIEVSQMQRLMIFLGHPVYGLGVVLFVLLLSSSMGSFAQRKVEIHSSRVWQMPALLCVICVVLGMLTPVITEHLKYYDTFIRIGISALLIAPMGFLMGMMFPIGIVVSKTHKDLLPFFWGINGMTSVFASVFAVVLSLQCGISASFWTGVACYVVCLMSILSIRKKTP